MRITQLRQRLHDLGAKPCHQDRLLRGWSQVSSYDRKGSPAATFFPQAMRNDLPAIEAELNGLAQLRSEHPAGEGVARLLVALHDGQMVESVLLPRGKRKLALVQRQHLSGLSDQLARQLADSTSREAGLFVSHELQEALDPRYQSELAQSIMAECERMLDEHRQ